MIIERHLQFLSKASKSIVQYLVKIVERMKQQVVEALGATLIGDNQKLQEANTILSGFATQAGYTLTLMEIVDDGSVNFPIKQAALIQLKNNIKSRWKQPKIQAYQLSSEQKLTIRNSLITAIIRCSKEHMLIKLYREILCNVIGFEYQNWIPMEQIVEQLKGNQNIPAVFHCILAICTNFQFSIIQKQRNYYSQFLYTILPEVLNTVQNNIGNSQIVYLSLKILYKAVHYDVPKEIKMLTNPWMELILLTITTQNENMKVDDFQHKGTPEFFYFHSKKWATRILMRFVQKHAKENVFGSTVQNSEFSQMWYKNYADAFVNAIIHQFSVPTIKKVRYFQLKIIQGWAHDKPNQMLNFASNFQYQLLLPFMALTPEDERLAQEDVVEYMRNEEQPGINFTNLKRAATDVWIAFFQIGSRTDREKSIYHPGPMFENNFQFLLQKLQSENLVEKELAMYLFCQIRITLNKVPQAKEMMPKVLANYVIPEFTNQAMLLRARANDMFAEYGKFISDFQLVKVAAEVIFKCMSEDPSPLVRIKAGIAFHPILSHPDSKPLVKDSLKNILEIYLKLIENYDLEPIISALEYIIADFSGEIAPFAIDLFKYLSGLFIKMFNKDAEQSQNEDYSGETEIAASGCLKTMTQIIEAPLEPEVRRQLEQPVLQVCAFLFSNESVDYTEDIMFLLNAHLFKVDKLSPDVWFFYQVVIYFLVGIPKELWAQIDNLPMPEPHKNILKNIRQCRNTEYLEHTVPVLRNFISKGANMIITQKEEFRNNFMQMFFYLISNIYKNHTQELEAQTELDCGTILMVYLVETFPPEFTKSVTPAIWNFIKFNFHKGKSSYLKLTNLQLMFVMFWKNPVEFQQLVAVNEKYLPVLGNFFKEYIPRLEDSHERKRVILGICSMLMLPQKTQELSNIIAFLFKTLTKLVRKNCTSRIILSLEAQDRKEEVMKIQDQQGDEEEQKIGQDEDDDDDFWDEDYHERFESTLARVDEIKHFQDTMTWLQNNDANLYQALIGSVSAEYLTKLNERMQTAMNLNQG